LELHRGGGRSRTSGSPGLQEFDLDSEYQQLVNENTRLIAVTSFNGTALLSGSLNLTFQVGAANNADNRISVTTSSALSITSGSLTSQANAQTAIGNMDTALNTVNGLRATFGATQTRFESVINGLQIAAENMAASRSRIMDADYASETAALTRAQILSSLSIPSTSRGGPVPAFVPFSEG
jgi:Flagellin and related hook-associated proteins